MSFPINSYSFTTNVPGMDVHVPAQGHFHEHSRPDLHGGHARGAQLGYRSGSTGRWVDTCGAIEEVRPGLEYQINYTIR